MKTPAKMATLAKGSRKRKSAELDEDDDEDAVAPCARKTSSRKTRKIIEDDDDDDDDEDGFASAPSPKKASPKKSRVKSCVLQHNSYPEVDLLIKSCYQRAS